MYSMIGDRCVAWIVRLAQTAADGEEQCCDVVEIDRFDDRTDTADMGLTPAASAARLSRLPPRPLLMGFIPCAPACPPRRWATRPQCAVASLSHPGGAGLPQPQDRHLQVRLAHHRLGERVRAHVFLCMLAYYLK